MARAVFERASCIGQELTQFFVRHSSIVNNSDYNVNKKDYSISGLLSASNGAFRQAADKRFIDFDPATQAIPIRPDHGSSQLMQPCPGRLVAAQSQDAL
jgi:hypothetical protein